MKTLLLLLCSLFTLSANAQLTDYLPRCSEKLLTNTWYADCYDDSIHTAVWVGWVIQKSHLEDHATRSNNFKVDKRVHSLPTLKYTNSGFDRGHMAPCQDFDWSQSAENETFLMSNICPQQPSLNRGIWKTLEEQCRKWAVMHDSILVVCGPLYSSIINTDFPVPTHFWKAVLFQVDEQWIMKAWIFPNVSTFTQLSQYQVTVNTIEEKSNIDLFESLPDELEDSLEQSVQQ